MDKVGIKHLEKEITEWRDQIGTVFYQQYMHQAHNQDYRDDGTDDSQIVRGVKYLFNHICVYLEVQGLREYLQLFRDNFGERVKDNKNILASSWDDPDEDPRLTIMTDIDRFLAPFQAFGYSAHKEDRHFTLIGILKETSFILRNVGGAIKNETSIYTKVKWVLQLYYPSCRMLSKGRFIQAFKSYHPDILIPELNTAIEYKYIRLGENIDTYLDQIRIDAANYTNDPDYENFIAVVCMQDKASSTEHTMRKAWNSKRFPSNWELIIVYT